MNVGGQLTLRPSDRVSLSLEATWQQGVDPRQYVSRIEGGTRTFGNRYIFGYIDRTTISTKWRLNYTFTPNLTLEGYAEPFLASGQYGRMGELVAPRSRPVARVRHGWHNRHHRLSRRADHYRWRQSVHDQQSRLSRLVVPLQRGHAVGVETGEHSVCGVATKPANQRQLWSRRACERAL